MFAFSVCVCGVCCASVRASPLCWALAHSPPHPQEVSGFASALTPVQLSSSPPGHCSPLHLLLLPSSTIPDQVYTPRRRRARHSKNLISTLNSYQSIDQSFTQFINQKSIILQYPPL
ncbi:hypothetical protein K440DRAFT_621573 [Wilcoxina mikolae CBS 423.85]|nr:hypothetical protein K440DRAFT_621573 [Wilcoxina mikolae CBS 423.85]